jgi:hypothetical protein
VFTSGASACGSADGESDGFSKARGKVMAFSNPKQFQLSERVMRLPCHARCGGGGGGS